jgi:hypothetical protein
MRSPKSWVMQLDVGRFAAAGAGAGELEQRAQKLRALDGVARLTLAVRCPGGLRKKSQFFALGSRSGGWGSMLMALLAGLLGLVPWRGRR